MENQYTPKIGNIVRLRNDGCGVVIDMSQTESDENIYKILFTSEIIKLHGPSLYHIDGARMFNIEPATEADLNADIDSAKKWYEEQVEPRLAIMKGAIRK
jgi:hypothetical protein